MGTIYYFLPGSPGASNDKLRRLGLGYLIPDDDSGADQKQTGLPDLGGGVAFAFKGANGRTMIDQALKKGLDWQPMNLEGAEGLQIAVDPDALPGPADLVRDGQHNGHPVTLGDGNAWKIASARGMPHKIEKVDGEYVRGEVLPAYAAFFAKCTRLWESYVEGIAATYDSMRDGAAPVKVEFDIALADVFALAEFGIELNHRISEVEISTLNLFIEESQREIVEALIDWPFWEEYLKKNGLEPSPADGEPTSTTGEQD